jgi:hypothetical protein
LWIALLAEALHCDLVWPTPVLAYRARLEALPWVQAEMTHYKPHCAEWVALKRGTA